VADDYPSKKNGHPNVLLVDPQKQIRCHLQEIITDSCGCNAVLAATASGALMRMDRQPFDLVLTDLSLPDADGKWLIEKIRRRRPGTRVIVLSEDGSAGGVLEAVRAGADDFLSKPLDAGKIVERVNYLLSGSSRARSSARWRRRTAGHLRRLRNHRQRLTEQVELVCRDLVGGYHRTIEKLLELQSQQDCRAAIDGELQIKPLLGTILRYLSDSFNGASGSVFLVPFTTARARLFTTTGGGPPANIQDYDQTLIKGIIRQTVQSGDPLLGSYSYDFDQAGADGSNSVQPFAGPSPRSLLASGLYAHGSPIAAIVLQRRQQKPFTNQEANLLGRLKGPLADSIELAIRLESTTSCQSDLPQDDS
jgi:DNA-binding NarL/FixJ family response regulator